eukprot:TRINITY_DN2398_c0_g2_i1.p3 TRINITY_DN2398_c0_g2~~TRINITY_DN2398_c0_g2_i1.p3  ORF type:complete len:224 (-),score=41.36 TRINITY_DN2398_c0_g2_i1:310-981(-)
MATAVSAAATRRGARGGGRAVITRLDGRPTRRPRRRSRRGTRPVVAVATTPWWMHAQAVEQQSLEAAVAAAAQELYQAPSPRSASAAGVLAEGGPVAVDHPSGRRPSVPPPTSPVTASVADGSSVPSGDVVSSVSDITSSLFDSTPSAGGASGGWTSAGGTLGRGTPAGGASAARAGGRAGGAGAEFPPPPPIPAALLAPQPSAAGAFDAPHAARGRGGASPG